MRSGFEVRYIVKNVTRRKTLGEKNHVRISYQCWTSDDRNAFIWSHLVFMRDALVDGRFAFGERYADMSDVRPQRDIQNVIDDL